MKKEFDIWLGGDYDYLGSFRDKEDAERGIIPNEYMYDIFDDFKGKRVKITVEVIEE
jgi:hypothetical protein